MRAFTLVFNAFFNSFEIIRRAKLKKFYFIPGFISIGLFLIFIWLSNLLSLNISTSLENIFKLQHYHSFIFIFIRILIWICSVFLYYLVYKSILIIVLSPILSYMSEKVENYLTGVTFNFTMRDNFNFILRGINIGIKSFFKQILGTILILLLSFIFPINLIIPILIFLIQSYFTGFSFMDYTLERHDLTPEESLNFLKKYRVEATLCGGIFTFLFFIPILGIFLAPITTCIATTSITLELLKKEGIKIPKLEMK